jgi:hypothetical protein
MTRFEKLSERVILPLAILSIAVVGYEVHPVFGAGILIGAIGQARVWREQKIGHERERRWRLREAAWRARDGRPV